ncbi:hypothetical protein [Periweissella cryptocerci]|nr:hypothetical protein [Periweissella cryptocerci]
MREFKVLFGNELFIIAGGQRTTIAGTTLGVDLTTTLHSIGD